MSKKPDNNALEDPATRTKVMEALRSLKLPVSATDADFIRAYNEIADAEGLPRIKSMTRMGSVH